MKVQNCTFYKKVDNLCNKKIILLVSSVISIAITSLIFIVSFKFNQSNTLNEETKIFKAKSDLIHALLATELMPIFNTNFSLNNLIIVKNYTTVSSYDKTLEIRGNVLSIKRGSEFLKFDLLPLIEIVNKLIMPGG